MPDKCVHPSTTNLANDIFLVGTQYFRAPTPMPEDWQRDLENIRECGMNIIRLWLVWSWMNPAPGRYDFEDVERLLELCKKFDIRAVLLTSLEGAPAWMVREHSDCRYVSRKGLDRYTTSGANLTPGGFPGLCMDHKIVQEKGSEWIAATAKHFSGHDVVYGWEPQNEPMMEGARYHDEVYCYCDATLERFRAWLKRRYGSVEALDKVWRQKHGCWDDVMPPREGGSWPDWIDWRNFALDNINDNLVWRKQAIADNAPNHAILMHGRANTGGLLDTNTQVIDDWRLAKLVDLYGQAAFPGRMGDVDYPLSMEVTRCSCPGKFWWQAELQGGGHGMGVGRHFILRGDKLSYWSWVAVAMGAKAVLYWQYRPERMGYEYGFGLTDLGGGSTDRTEAVKKLSGVLGKHAKLFNTAQEQNNDVALTCSPNSYIIHGVSEDMATAPIDAIKGIYAVLMEADLGADVVRADEEAVDDDYSKYKMIVMPCPTWISARTAEKLREFVSNGGTLISEASLGQYDERLLASTIIPGMGMDEVFGIRRAESEILSVEETELLYKKIRIPSRYYREVLVPKGAEVIGTHDDGRPAITSNNFGKGRAVYIGSNPFMQYFHDRNDQMWAFMQDMLADIPREAYTDSRAVQARTLTSGDKRIVFVLNNKEEAIKATLTVANEKRTPVEIINEGKVNSKQSGSDIKITENMSPFDVKCYLFG